MLEKENNQCHCTQNCGCKSHHEEHTSCGCNDQNDLDKKIEFDNNCECCEEEEACGCNDHTCGCNEHHEHN